MSVKIWLIRHGETAWNERERFRGRTDLPLSERGRRQAERIGPYLAGRCRPAAVFTSPLQRARETAAAVAAHFGLEAQEEPGLLDIDFGAISGLTPEEMAARYPALHQAWLQAPHTVRFPQGESLSSVRCRVAEFIWRVAEEFQGQAVVLVSHLVVCRVLTCYLLQLAEAAFWAFEFGTASISAFRLEQGRATLLELNNTSHLARLE